jgi:membrane protein YqaA with SNARE-associated domain
MSIISSAVEWSKEIFLPFGELGLFIVAFIESSFFPVPPDILLIPLSLINPGLAFFYAAVATIGSVLGSILGYYIGLKGGRPVLNRIAGKKRVSAVEKYFSKYGDMAIGIAAFTPIPYKIFTIASGTFRHNLPRLILISVIGRGGRFFLEALFLVLFGEQIIFFMDRYFGLFTLLIGFLVVAGYFVYKKYKK